MPSDRRQFLVTAAGAALLPLANLTAADPAANPARLRVLCVGGHPDDPETGCGGTLAHYAAAGADVAVLYLTRGERGIKGKSPAEAAAIRTAEALAACRELGARALFFDELAPAGAPPAPDAGTRSDDETLQRMRTVFAREQPDLVLAHWPVDSHRDHQIASLLATQAWMKSDRRAAFYYYEVCSGRQTMLFAPTDHVDITATQAQKRRAVFCHASQDPAHIYADDGHDVMEVMRGRAIGTKAAEAFVRLSGRTPTTLP